MLLFYYFFNSDFCVVSQKKWECNIYIYIYIYKIMREDFVVFDVSPSDELDRYLVFDRNGLYCYRR